MPEPLVLHDVDGRDLVFSQVRLEKSDISKNGYFVWINGVYVITKGPVVIESDGDYSRKVTVILAVRSEDLIEE